MRKLLEYLQLQVDERRLGCLEKHLSGEKKYILEKCLRKPDENNLAAKLVISFLYYLDISVIYVKRIVLWRILNDYCILTKDILVE